MCVIFPNSINNITIVIGHEEYQVSLFNDLISLKTQNRIVEPKEVELLT